MSSGSTYDMAITDSHFFEVMRECWDLYLSKGMDYTQGEWAEDRLSSFRKAAKDAGVSLLQAWSVLFSKHLHAIQRYTKDEVVESELIESRIFDAINYMILLLLMVKEKRDLKSTMTDATDPALLIK